MTNLAGRLEDQRRLIQGVIHDAEGKQVRDERVRVWLSMLQSIVYDIDDLLDKIDVEDHRKKATRLKAQILFHLVSPFNFIKTSKEFRHIQDTFEGLVSKIPTLVTDVRLYESSGRRQTGGFVNESEIVGREHDKKMVIEMLLSSTCSKSICVLPIVGMGGIGKTTLAQLVYNDPHLENYFELRMWISVGGSLNVRELMIDILQYVDRKDAYGTHLPQLALLQSRLKNSLRGRKYLLVLDDVWNKDEAEWRNLIEQLSYGAAGCRIMVTTRNRDVATLMGTHASFFDLKPLCHDDCWILFKQCAFRNGEEDDYTNLAEIGKDIVNTCDGNPFAATVLGNLLRHDGIPLNWLSVQFDEVLRNLRCNPVLSALRLSYDFLPPNQKRCFSYCSVFPKNYNINRERLIHQWIAEGLIPSYGGWKEMEDTANVYFNDLVNASLFESVSYTEDGKMDDFKVHNLLHDLARSVSETVVENSGHYELFLCRADRRAYIVCNEFSSTISKRLSSEKLRNLQLQCRGYDSAKVFRSLFKRQHGHIRVLKLSNCGITTLDESVGNLIYLRYLDLSHNPMRKLPETVCRLFKLQTLDLSSCQVLEELPNDIINLEQLSSLNIEDCLGLKCMPPYIGELRNLRTLPIFILGSTYGQSLHQLIGLNLRGKLKIKKMENAQIYHLDNDKITTKGVFRQFTGSCLERMELHTISLSWGEEDEGNDAERHNLQGNPDHDPAEVLNCLAPNCYMRVLHIKEYPGTEFPRWIGTSNLPNMTKLFLINCRRCVALPVGLEHASSLVSLEIHGCPKLQELPDWIGSLAALTSLTISACENITFLPDGMRSLQRLQHISISDCPALEVRCRDDTGDDWNKISHVPFKHVGAPQRGESSASTSAV